MIKRSPKIFSSRPKLVIASSCIVAFGCQEYNFNKRVDPNEAVEETAIPPETEVPEEVTVPICENEDSLEFDIQMVEDCYVEAIVGTWTPVIEWTSTAPGDTYTTPVVGLLNGDDIPDVVVANVSGVTYALSGDTGAVIWSAGNVGFEPMTSAIADVNGDGLNDVVSGGSYGVTAFNGTDGSVIWSTSELSNGNTPQCGAIGLHDLEGDGTVEVVVGNMVLNGIDGSVRWKGTHGSGAGHGWAAPMGVAADVLRNGTLQVVVGNALYNPDGSVAWANGQSDGFVAVGQFDSDPEGEIVVAHTGTLRLQDHDGTVLWTRPGLTGSTIGPPTVADFNNDGEPEIGVAGNGVYIVVDKNGTDLWSRPTVDFSSGFTGSAVFDFEGDGSAEVVYADENDVWVFNGSNGDVKMQETRHSSATCSEYPSIADVDNDGHAEIIYSSGYFSGSETGVTVIGDSNNSWRPGRTVWNQHAYYLTNTNLDGTIPETPDINWEQYNTFRSGDQGAGQGGEYPDLVVEIEDVCTEFCDVNMIYVYGRIGNQGVSQIDGDVVLDLQGITPDGFPSLATKTLTGPFPPGKMFSTFTLEVNTAGQELYGLTLLVDKGNEDEGFIFECNEINDQAYWGETVCQ